MTSPSKNKATCPRCTLRLLNGTLHDTAEDCLSHLVPRYRMARIEATEGAALRRQLMETREAAARHCNEAKKLRKLIRRMVDLAYSEKRAERLSAVA